MPGISFLFWNVNRNLLDERVGRIVASEHVPCMAQAEAGDLGEVVEIRKRRSSCHRFTVLGGDAILRAAANVCTGHMS